jgi:hypothetical protein
VARREWHVSGDSRVVTLSQVLERVAEADTTVDRDVQRRIVIDTIRALGHEVANDGQVYNPAEGCYRPAPVRVVPRDQRWAGRRR